MKQASEKNRIDYSNHKHHRQLVRQAISPQLIQHLEFSPNPALNYNNAIKAVYMDELQKTMLFQRTKKQLLSQSRSTNSLPSKERIFTEPSTSDIQACSPVFTDYDQERNIKFDTLINKNFNGGQDFFRAQDQYQHQKQKQAVLTQLFLDQQITLKHHLAQRQQNAKEQAAQQVRLNWLEENQREQQRIVEQRLRQRELGRELQRMGEEQRARRGRRSELREQQGRHNPITNPIEFHIDNPYILQKIQKRML